MEGVVGFADFYGQTRLHPFALLAVVVFSVLVFVLPRRMALVPLLVAAVSVPMAQRVVIAGADFTLLRLLLLAYLIRVILRGDWVGFIWNRLDTAIILWVISGITIMTIHYGTVDAFVNRAGWAYDIILTYFSGRLLLRQWSDILMLVKSAAVISVPAAGLFVLEWATQYNIFHVFGGVPELTRMREGRLRCQGPFAHPIIAGTFWAAMLPLIWMLWENKGKFRALALVGTASAFLIIAASSSSTPVLAAMAAGFGAMLFLLRRHRTQMWVALFSGVLILHFVVMEAPVWHLISRVDVIGGSTGWHRFVIFDTFVRHFSDWYITGYSTPTEWRWEMRDITNQYMGQGLSGGLLTLVAFILVLTFAFANVGMMLEKATKASREARVFLEWRVWLVGVMVFVHVTTFWGLSYFGQMSTLFYLQLSLAGGIAASFSVKASETGDAPPSREQNTLDYGLVLRPRRQGTKVLHTKLFGGQ